ncbi:hypothetical protein SUGI_0123270 [Cryptomeria japonica]|nr:hypothetical protein SUGI_0123270 [Cryptomeria japonica]
MDRRVFRANKEEYAAELTISSQEHHYQVKLAVDKKVSVPCNNSSHSSAPRPERSTRLQHPINNIMSTRSSNHTDQTNIMQHSKPLNLEPLIWPKICLTLPLGQIEEDFLAIKGSKLPVKPKKRLKSIQRTIHSVSPGGWLNDISQERYEVREKKCTKKRPRGLKSMRKAESDSE